MRRPRKLLDVWLDSAASDDGPAWYLATGVSRQRRSSMSGRVMRDFRRQTSKAARQALATAAPAILDVSRNEQVTRKRVDALEAVVNGSFLVRLRWLLFGPRPQVSVNNNPQP